MKETALSKKSRLLNKRRAKGVNHFQAKVFEVFDVSGQEHQTVVGRRNGDNQVGKSQLSTGCSGFVR
jgi:hypothetical protein